MTGTKVAEIYSLPRDGKYRGLSDLKLLDNSFIIQLDDWIIIVKRMFMGYELSCSEHAKINVGISRKIVELTLCDNVK